MKKLVFILICLLLLLTAFFFIVDLTGSTVDIITPVETEEDFDKYEEKSALETDESTPEPTETPDTNTYDDMYSSIYSHTDISDDLRLENIKRAIEKIDGVKIMPGETFSFNDTVGSTSDYNEAAVYDSRYPEDEVYEVGGGTSLVASTLYCSSIYACMTPIERYPHHFWITSSGYLKRGCDAYVCNNGQDETKDLKISNPFSTPVMIKAYLDENSDKLYVEFWGTNTDEWHAEPFSETSSLYMSGENKHVCNRYVVENYRKVSNKYGVMKEAEDLNFDYDGDGNKDYDVYWWHERDLDWSGGH